MFKSMLKRSWLSIRRKLSRSVIVLVILFVMANMLLATVAIKNSVANSVQFAKEQIGGTVYLQPDVEALRNVTQNSDGDNSSTATPTTRPTISESLAKNIANSDYVKDYTYSLSASANSDGYTVVQTAQNEREQQFKDALNNAQNQAQDQLNQFNQSRDQFNREQNLSGNSGNSRGGGSRGEGRQFNFNFNLDFADPTLTRGDTTIQGINSFDFVSDVEAGNMKIVDGQAFDETTKNGVVISKALADANSLKVGSDIKFKTTTDPSTEVTLKIVGIYETSTEDFDYNTVYMNIDSAKQFLSADSASNPTVQNVRYYLDSAEDKDAFLASAAKNNPEIKTDNLKLDVDDSSYQTMVGPIEQVGSFASTVFWIVVVATIVIITLVVVINIKDRRYEMGVLLSLGARRTNIIGQIFVELFIIGTFAFALSLGTSQIVAQKIGSALLDQQVASSNQSQTDNASQRGANAPSGMRVNFMNQATSNTQQIKTIDVAAGPMEYLSLFGIGYAILLVSLILPSINVLRYQPKTILSGKE